MLSAEVMHFQCSMTQYFCQESDLSCRTIPAEKLSGRPCSQSVLKADTEKGRMALSLLSILLQLLVANI